MFVIYVKISILAGKCLAWGPLYMLAIRRLPNKTFWMAPQNGQLASHWQVSPLEVLISCYIANLLYSLSTYYPILKSNMYIIYFLPTLFLIIILIWAKVYNTTFECRIFFFFHVYLVGKFITLRYCFVKWILIFGDFLVFNKYPIAWSNN